METRAKALKWWRGLSLGEQRSMVDRHHNDGVPFIAIATSSSKIERMFIKEQNGKETS